jgi:2-phosphoglycerate kinase
LQDYLIDEAKKCNVPVIDNSNGKDLTLESIMKFLR